MALMGSHQQGHWSGRIGELGKIIGDRNSRGQENPDVLGAGRGQKNLDVLESGKEKRLQEVLCR